MAMISKQRKVAFSAMGGIGGAVVVGVQMAGIAGTFVPMATKVLLVAATGVIYSMATYGAISIIEEADEIAETFRSQRSLQ